MTISIEQLITPKTTEEALGDVLDLMGGLGFQTTSFHAGSLGLGFATIIAEVWVRSYNAMAVPAIKQAFNETATGVGLTWLSTSHFDNTRIGAIATQGTLTLTDATSSGPHTVTAGQFVAADANDSTVTFRALTGAIVALDGTATISIECERGGVLGNVPNARITQLVTSIAGLTVTNGVADGDSWITRQGVNAEADKTLRLRNTTKWASLSPNAPINAYKNMVLNAVDPAGDAVGVTKVEVDASNPGGPGTLYVYVANTTATATAQQVIDLQAYIDDGRGSPNAIPTVIAATEFDVNIYGTLTCRRGLGVAALSAFQLSVQEYLDDLDLGGEQLDSERGGAGYVLVSSIVDRARNINGVVNYVSSAPATDLAIARSQLAVMGAWSVQLVEI